MIRRTRLVCWLLALCCGLPACARNYRLEGGGGAAPPRGVFNLLWQRKLVKHGFLSFRPQEWASGVIDGQGRLYIGSSAGQFMALEAGSGKLLWSVKTQGAISSRPHLDAKSGMLYFGGDDGRMYAVDAKRGTVKWKYGTQGTINREPVLAEGFVLFATSEGRIYALDAATGKWRWQYERELPEGFTIQGYAGVAVKGSTAYTGFADGTLVALKVFSGDVVWTRSLTGGKSQFVDVDTTPVIVGDLLLAASYASGVYAISADTGSVRWQHPVEGATAVAIHRDRVFFAAPEVGVVALDMSGRLIWRQSVPKGVPSVPVAEGPYLFLTGTETGLFAVAASDGSLLQYFDPGHGISAPPAVGAGYLSTLSNQGRLYVFRIPAIRM